MRWSTAVLCHVRAALLRAKDESFYGVTSYGGGAGTFNPGTAYQLVRNGKGYAESIVHTFGAGTDGLHPMDPDGLIADKAGNRQRHPRQERPLRHEL